MLKTIIFLFLLAISVNNYAALKYFNTSVDRGTCADDLCVMTAINNAIQAQLNTSKATKIESIQYTFFKHSSVTGGRWVSGNNDSFVMSDSWSAHNYVNTAWQNDAVTKIMAVVWYDTSENG